MMIEPGQPARHWTLPTIVSGILDLR
jgi:hypothetical protein